MIKAVVFDLDDTLWESFKPGFKRYSLLARELGLAPPSEQQFARLWGHAWHDWIKSIWPGIDSETFRKAYNKRFGVPRHNLFDGVADLLEGFSRQGIAMGLLSSRQSDSLVERAELSGLDLSLFRFVYTADNLDFKKPDARAFDKPLQELSSLGISKGETLYVGDNLVDFAASKGAGVGFVAVLTGITTKKDFLQAGLEEKRILAAISGLPAVLQSEFSAARRD